LIKEFVGTRDTAGLHCFGIICFCLAAGPQLKLTAGPGMICPENTPECLNAYAPGMPHQVYSMYVGMPELAVIHTTSTLKRRKIRGELQRDWGLV